MKLEYSRIENEPYIWHWTVEYTEVSNNYYVVRAFGPRGEGLELQGADDPERLISQMVSTILHRSPAQDRKKYPDFEGRIVDDVYYIKNTVYRLDISFVIKLDG